MEWCFDAWNEYPKGQNEVTVDPFKIGRPDKETFVVRGGAWWSGARRVYQLTGDSRIDNNANGFRGFRIVLGPRNPRHHNQLI